MSGKTLLSGINGPEDVKKLSQEQLPQLAGEIGELIKSVVEENGGHYSSPLGVIDLTVALHYVFDSPRDKLVWDVGHQAYSHKIITGRREQFKTIRTKDGISGFLKRSESEHDHFGAGHASTSISAALGMAAAHHLSGDDHHVVAIIGDGALTGGLAYEGLNNLGFTRRKMTVVLNDNRMSISPSVGSISQYLTRIVTNPFYNRIRDELWNITGKMPVGTDAVRRVFKSVDEGLKSLLTPGVLFEELGLRYLGPIDGHDYAALIRTFKAVKALPYPTLVHVLTKKGHGVEAAEKDSVQYYSMAGSRNKKKATGAAPDYSKVFGQVVSQLARENDKVVAVTAAMEVGTGYSGFAKEFPDRLYDVGIAEGHALTFAAGLATQGLFPVVALYSTFMQRAFDQMMHDVALQELPVLVCLDRAGIVGPDGPTHHGVFDMALFRTIPGVIVAAPKDGNELRSLICSALGYRAPMVIRYPKTGSINFDPDGQPDDIPLGSWEILSEGGDAAICAVGSMVPVAEAAARELRGEHGLEVRVVNARFVKPLDREMLDDMMVRQLPILTLEEGVISGGFGSAVQEYGLLNGHRFDMAILGIGDEFVEHGTRGELLELAGLSTTATVARLLTLVENRVAQ
ncbi:MAG: 1-deoxy-D-xylulose-5-phosphate synthase [Candidatus Marinimicrobia bacterium]|nr:1-deoxy-D-xylulose-5-phosphate synthase [Candidatus Neomarinimicrobiota bacterium]